MDQETRLFDAARGETRSMRSKEEAHDYRYFPDPDLLPLEFDQAFVDNLAAELPELPDDKRRDGKQAANWVINDLLGALNKTGLSIEKAPISPTQLGELLDLIREEVISGKIAKDVFEILLQEGGSPRTIVEERGLKQVTDSGAIEVAVDEIIKANPDKVAQAQAKPALAGWFVGQVMKSTGGKANPQTVNALIKAKLGLE